MRKWLTAIAAIGLAVMAYLFVFNRSTRLDSTKQPGPVAAEAIRTNDAGLLTAPPVAALSNRDVTLNTPTVQHNSVAQPIRTEPSAHVANLPEPSLPEDELPRLPAATVLENVNAAFRNFRSKFTSNPVGTNQEITRALNGENPGQVRFLRMEDGMRLNGNGELIDPWGTPYFFHQLSGTEMEIHCAGPDKVMWTTDDLVVK